MALRLDYTFMMGGGQRSGVSGRARAGGRRSAVGGQGAREDEPGVAGGIAGDEWKDAESRYREAAAVVDGRRRAGELGFLDLPGNAVLHDSTVRLAESLGHGVTDVVVLGIGGSALGPIALRTALCAPLWNSLPNAADGAGRGPTRDGRPRLHVVDNIDPRTLGALLDTLHLATTLVVVISKSGATAETMAQYLVVRERLERSSGIDVTKRLVFITDPDRGALRAIARRDRIAALDIPPNVGGRFSVLSPVGLFPARLAGIDSGSLLAGAADMAHRCRADALRENPAACFAALQWLADTRHGRGIHVLMPYSDALRDVAAWFVQLWAESLGKMAGGSSGAGGPTPLPALGATDQHSQVQLFMEGPANKTVTFLTVGERAGEDLTIPSRPDAGPELAYLGGHTMGELLDAEGRATAGALAARGRPNMTLHLDRVDAWHVGGLIMMLETATVIAAALYGVNPLDQPGVELGKRFTWAVLGRPDSADARREWEALPKPDPRWSV